MDTWEKIVDDAPAVLRALADGRKARRDDWGDGATAQLRDGELLGYAGHRHFLSDFSGTWYIEPERDIATDPQVGDQFHDRGHPATVLAVVANEGVLYRWTKGGHVFVAGQSTADWATHWSHGTFSRRR